MTTSTARSVGVPFRVIRTPHRGPAAARNAGAAATDTPWLVFVDADVVVPPDTFARLADDLERWPDAAAVWATVTAEHPHPGLVSRYKNLAHRHFTLSQRRDPDDRWAETRHLTTMLAAVRRSAFDAVGGFDEAYSGVAVEDVELGRELFEAGHRVVLDLELQVGHSHRFTPLSALRNDFAKVRHHARATLRRRATGDRAVAVEAPGERRQVRYLFSVPLGAGAILAAATGRWGGALALLGAMAAVERDLVAYLAREQGPAFALAVLPWMAVERTNAAVAVTTAVTSAALESLFRKGSDP